MQTSRLVGAQWSISSLGGHCQDVRHFWIQSSLPLELQSNWQQALIVGPLEQKF